MGIGNAALELLIALRRAEYLKPGGAVAEIGAQQLSNSLLSAPERVAYLGGLFGNDRPLALPPPSAELESEQDWEILTAPFARDFWRWLGFQYTAIDIDGSPDSIPLDLNYDSVPPEAIGKYNLVTNFGTTEHVTNQLNAFNVIHDLTATDGIMLHEVPAQGMFNHGLLNYNFKFFWLLMRSNGYKFIYADFLPAERASTFPNNIEEYLNASELEKERRRRHDYNAVDAGWLLAMQKSFDMPFIPPVDVNTGMPTENKTLKERYWTVFEPDRFDAWQASAAKARDAKSREASKPSDNLLSPDQSAQAEQASAPSESALSFNSWRIGALLKRWRMIIRRVVHNSDATAYNSDAIVQGIANQSDMIRRKLDALNRVMHELREIQKAQLAMQRQAAEAIRQVWATSPNPAKTEERSGPV